MLIANITRKVLMNWYALTFTAIFTLGLTGAVGLTAARRTSFRPSVRLPSMTREIPCTARISAAPCRMTEFYRGARAVHHPSQGEAK
jgi:hypothetical protein